MTLLVRNEEDIIRENILYHLNQGVDFIIAMDNKSTDRTIKILRDFESKKLLHLILQNDDNYAQSQWVTQMARMAYQEYNADWIINSDADEFWWPLNGNLKSTLAFIPVNFTGVEVQRFDFIPRPGIKQNPVEQMIIKDNFPKNHLGRPLPPKICHRGMAEVEVAQGNHSLIHPTDINILKSDFLEIFHFPMRSYNQFASKIALGGAAYTRNDLLPKTVAMGWRNLFEEYKAGRLVEYYHSKELSVSEIEHGIKDGRFCHDTRLRDYLKNIDKK